MRKHKCLAIIVSCVCLMACGQAAETPPANPQRTPAVTAATYYFVFLHQPEDGSSYSYATRTVSIASGKLTDEELVKIRQRMISDVKAKNLIVLNAFRLDD